MSANDHGFSGRYRALLMAAGLLSSWPQVSFCRRTPLARRYAGARSSAEEHYLDMVGVTGSIPVAPTIKSSS
jgi:hypothetical protein